MPRQKFGIPVGRTIHLGVYIHELVVDTALLHAPDRLQKGILLLAGVIRPGPSFPNSSATLSLGGGIFRGEQQSSDDPHEPQGKEISMMVDHFV